MVRTRDDIRHKTNDNMTVSSPRLSWYTYLINGIMLTLSTSGFVSKNPPVSWRKTLPSPISVDNAHTGSQFPHLDDSSSLSRRHHISTSNSNIILQALPELIQTTANAYTASLIEHPLPTKSLSAGFLCGISDIIAQKRDPNRGKFNPGRTFRFASKGCVGGILWAFWYDRIDGFLDLDSPTSLYALAGLTATTNAPSIGFLKEHVGAVTTLLSMLMEQFLWCPIVYGTFEIPVSTLMNGGEVVDIKDQVDAKLDDLLLQNAKVWTFANLVIYNAPLEWRLLIGNGIDIFWQSIVSDVSADCGKVEDDVCEIPDDLIEGADPSFYAEKSRI